MAYRVHGAEDREQSAYLDSMGDRVAGRAQPDQLTAGYVPVLTSGDCGDGGVKGARHGDALAPLCPYTGSFVQTQKP